MLSDKVDDIMKDDIANAENINYDTFQNYLNRQKRNDATKDEKVAIEKYLYKKHWKLKDASEVDDEFLDKYYRKTHVLFNLRALVGNDEIEPLVTLDDGTKMVNFDKAVRKEQIRMIKDVMKKLGFSLGMIGDIEIDRDKFIKRVEKVKISCELFSNTAKSQPLFGFSKTKIESVKSFLGFMNSLLKEWGLRIGLTKFQKRYKDGNKWMTKSIYKYSLLFDGDINDHL